MGALQFARSRLALRARGSMVRRSGRLHECDERGNDRLFVGIPVTCLAQIPFGSDGWHIDCIPHLRL
jgi:hypothetical protein